MQEKDQIGVTALEHQGKAYVYSDSLFLLLPGHHAHTAHDITKLEKVQHRAARYIFNDYSSFHSTSAMLN